MTAQAAPTTASGPANGAGRARGFWNVGSSGYNGLGSSADHGRTITVAAAATQAHHRQRGEGSDPVGVSSRTKPAQAGQRTEKPLENPAR